MHGTSRPVLQPTLVLAAAWLDEIAARTGTSPRMALNVLRAVLRALRDRLPADAAAAFGRPLPALIRGLWFEDWHPEARPVEDATLADWLVTLEGHLLAADADAVPAGDAASAVFALLNRHLGAEDRRRIAALVPDDLGDLLRSA